MMLETPRFLVLATVLAAAAPAHAEETVARAVVVHVPPTVAPAGTPIELEAMIDAPYAETLTVRWRPLTAVAASPAWRDLPFERSSAGGWFVSLPATASTAPGIEYFIRGTDAAGAEVEHFASAGAPHVVRVEPSLHDRLEAIDRARLGSLADEVSFDVVAHNFGNRYELRDQFIRAELVYSHRLLRVLHEIGFGFGSINGYTPADVMPDTTDVYKGMHYGFGQVRLRAHPSVFVDARLGLGVSQDAFEGSARGAVTFGKPWRSSVTVGAEYIGALGPTAWVRLQWDTAPPLLMGASIVRTDLPGAIVDAAGLYIAYDVAYRMAERITARAQLSYGARDGAAHLGGGLGTAIAF